jgi:flagellar basal-body rod protein FlgC
MFDSLDISSSALLAQRVRMDTVAGNLANMNVTRNSAGKAEPYRRRFVVFEPTRMAGSDAAGVRVKSIEQDRSPFHRKYEPGHPDRDAEGYVMYPNVDLAVEVVNMMEASRAYEANVTAMEVTKAMINASLRLLA